MPPIPSLKNENAIDVVLFVNGIPVATAELKNLLTGSTFKHAEKQYRTERSPAGEPLLTFKRGALVHFALDEDNVSMTTRLMNGKTGFLPFNRGRDGGAGNPDIAGDFRVGYLYADQPEGKAIFSREVWLDVIGKFVHLEQGDDGKATMIFPRFQQLDAVRRMTAHARAHGAGNNYLIQHSAGSGKSNTIGWTAHQAINLHDGTDQPIFNTAIIVTDRIVLDRQLQSTVSQFEQTRGIVRKIDGTSRDLKAAIESGARIIITTIQKFSTEHLAAISGQGTRKFAIIVDEAHSSQSGRSAQAMTDALTREATSSDDIEDLIADYQRQRGPQANISFFAFTATPRNVTVERFGTRGVRWPATPVPSLFDASGHRGRLHPRCAPLLHDLPSLFPTGKGYRGRSRAKQSARSEESRPLRLPAPDPCRSKGRNHRRTLPPTRHGRPSRPSKGYDRYPEPRARAEILSWGAGLPEAAELHGPEGARRLLWQLGGGRRDLDRTRP
jgi:type I restriction enzyme, R subunit